MNDIIKACLITGGSMFGFFVLIIGIIILIIVNPFKRKNIRPITTPTQLSTPISTPIQKNKLKCKDKLQVGEYLGLDEYIQSENDKYIFKLNTDGTICLMENTYKNNKIDGDVYTCINDPNPKIRYATINCKGNFILQDDEKNILYETNTNKENSYVKISNIGIVGIYDDLDNLIYTFVG